MIPYIAKCDLYSFGVMAYELVYGQFSRSNRAGNEQLLKNIRKAPLRFPVDIKVVKGRKLNIGQFLRVFDSQSDGKLNLQEFTQFIKQLAPGLKQGEKKFDKNQDREISFSEFKEQLVQGTQFNSKFDPEVERAKKLLSDLKRIVRTSGSNPQQIFNDFDKNRSSKLEFNEFQNICKIIDRNSTIEFEKVMFQLVNQSNSQGISFQDFQQIFK